MKQYLIKLCFFLIPLLVISIPLDFVISGVLKKEHNFIGDVEVWNDIYSGNIDCEMAIYGSSRAWVHINPEILEDSFNIAVYNFGIDGHNFWLQYLRHLEFVKYCATPKYILVSVDAFSLQKRPDLYQYRQFLPFMLWNKNIKQYTSDYTGFSTLDYYIPMLRYIKERGIVAQIIDILTKNEHRYRNKGFAGMDKTWNSDFDKAKAISNKYKITFDSLSVVLFEQFLSECKNNKIEVYLIYTPEYIAGQEYFVNKSELMDLYQAISQKYQVDLIDYTDDTICYNKDLFYNSMHLNKTGADIISSKIAYDLLNCNYNPFHK